MPTPMPVRMALLTLYSMGRRKARVDSPASAAKMMLAIVIEISLRRVEIVMRLRSRSIAMRWLVLPPV